MRFLGAERSESSRPPSQTREPALPRRRRNVVTPQVRGSVRGSVRFPATAQAYWDEVLEHAFAAKLDNIKKYPQKHPQNPYTVPELCGGWE
eukprot:scaffold103684_cov52-Phaeocystis_antarctica.AAC.1